MVGPRQKLGKTLTAAVQIDTGMCRLGLSLKSLKSSPPGRNCWMVSTLPSS